MVAKQSAMPSLGSSIEPMQDVPFGSGCVLVALICCGAIAANAASFASHAGDTVAVAAAAGEQAAGRRPPHAQLRCPGLAAAPLCIV